MTADKASENMAIVERFVETVVDLVTPPKSGNKQG
jgi:hypothetical protein